MFYSGCLEWPDFAISGFGRGISGNSGFFFYDLISEKSGGVPEMLLFYFFLAGFS